MQTIFVPDQAPNVNVPLSYYEVTVLLRALRLADANKDEACLFKKLIDAAMTVPEPVYS